MQGFFRHYLSVYRPLITKLNVLLGEYDLSYSLWQVIFFVKNNGPSTLVDISSHYNIEKPSITRSVHRLEEMLLVKQIPGKDRREKIIELTDSGEEIYQTCRAKITELEHMIMKDIPENMLEAAFQVFPLIRENLNNKEGK
ncbi:MULTISPECIES: MarR family winged helix-turn-helix transcriptional regulator [Bacillaceae]|uniref:DNA-binding MarR family transcriptional regulator n=1 Tax=Peribacillus huizhouensis TaxID=1501239 RepID=A0ABR6CNA3_9BACI|nr:MULTISPECIES: winged helix DNA-binding protein [Bacillaceae]MBA9026498.1 DNA-binding MarR family transcriptional regulator [Peribacillus huizhouensis]